jgi:uncharacterized membrane protein
VPNARRRVVAVDVLRLLATVQMIQGHTLDAIWAADPTSSGFAAWSWVRGLTSVAFLFAAGLSYYLAALSAPVDRVRAGRGKRIRRGVQLILVGYAMHFPGGAGSIAEALRLISVIDILQCIGVTLIALEGIQALARKPVYVAALAGSIAAVIYAVTPWGSSLPVEGPFAPLTSYVSAAGGSIFPLLPYSGAMLIGCVAGVVAFPQNADTKLVTSIAQLAALVVVIVWFIVETSDADVRQALLKLAVVVAITAALVVVTRSIERLPAWLETLAGETLVMYVAHVVVLYASFVGLATVVGKSLSLGVASVAAVVMIVAMAALGLAWHAAKARLAARRGKG